MEILWFFNIEQNDPVSIINADQAVIDDIVKNKPSSIRILKLNEALIFSPMENPASDQVQVCEMIRENHEFKFRVATALERKYEPSDPEEKEVEDRIHDQFKSPDRPILEEFQNASWEHRLELVHAMEDPRYRQWGCDL